MVIRNPPACRIIFQGLKVQLSAPGGPDIRGHAALTVFNREHKVERTTFLSPQVTMYVNALVPFIGNISNSRISAALPVFLKYALRTTNLQA